MTIKLMSAGSTPLEYRKKQWGLSFLVDNNLVFDTFCSAELLEKGFRDNTINPKSIEYIVISHEHWDHIGGLWWLLEQTKGVGVYGCSHFSNAFKRKVDEYGGSFISINDFTCIKKDIFVTGEIEGTYKGKPLYELSLVVKQEDTAAVVTGCSHPGILRILDTIKNVFTEEIILLTGGLHLMNTTGEALAEITAALQSRYHLELIAPFHCTGSEAVNQLKSRMHQCFKTIEPGDSIVFNEPAHSWEIVKRR
jgi:7,8-dihydropterin-6-yl-methyl-4-(beta-D-ribofuranosyl)aminobenzene 5'-phosphate synthase